MSEDNTTQPTEQEALLERAKTMGLKVRKDMTVETLREKVNDALKSKDASNDEDESKKPAAKGKNAERLKLKREAEQLVRVRVTCMNPNKREYDGDMFCAGNRVVGTFKKYVPFDTEWHVPRIIFKMLKRKRCQVFVTKKDDKGRPVREGKSIPEFNVEELPPLTQQELDELAQRQAMARGTAAA